MNERGQGWQDLAGKWNSMTPDGPKITLTLEPTPTGTNTLIEKVTASYSAGVQPDLLHSAYWDGGVYGVQGMAVELDSTFIKRDKAYRDSLADFFPHLLESSKWRGKLWSLPQETNADLPYTNLALVRAAGLQPLRAGYTWDQLVEHCKGLQRSLGPNKWAISGMIGGMVQFTNLLKQNGGELYDKDHTKVLVNSPEGIEAMQYAADLVHKHQVHAPRPPADAPPPDFRLGQLAMNYETSALRLVQWAEFDRRPAEHVRLAVADEEAPVRRLVRPEHHAVQDQAGAAGGGLAGAAVYHLHGRLRRLRRRDHVLARPPIHPQDPGLQQGDQGRSAVPDLRGRAGLRLPAVPPRVRVQALPAVRLHGDHHPSGLQPIGQGGPQHARAGPQPHAGRVQPHAGGQEVAVALAAGGGWRPPALPVGRQSEDRLAMQNTRKSTPTAATGDGPAYAFKLGVFLDETGHPFERAVEIAQELGAAHVEFFVRDPGHLTEAGAVAYRRRLDAAGLRAHAVGASPNPLKQIHIDQIALADIPTHPEVQHDLDLLRRSIDFARGVGAPNVLVQGFAWPGEYDGNRRVSPTWPQRYATHGGDISPETLDKLTRAFGLVADLAERHAIDVAVGMMPWNYTGTGRNFRRIVERVGSTRLRCKWGPADSYTSGEQDTVGTTHRLLRPYLTSIHLKDAHVLDGPACRFEYVPTGTGDVPYAALFEQFARDRVDSVIAVATHYRVPDAPPEAAMRINVRNTRRLMERALVAAQGAGRPSGGP